MFWNAAKNPVPPCGPPSSSVFDFSRDPHYPARALRARPDTPATLPQTQPHTSGSGISPLDNLWRSTKLLLTATCIILRRDEKDHSSLKPRRIRCCTAPLRCFAHRLKTVSPPPPDLCSINPYIHPPCYISILKMFLFSCHMLSKLM